MLERLARWSYVHRWRILILWIVALVGIGYLGSAHGGDYSTDFSLPGTESQQAFDLLQQRFPARSGDTAEVQFKVQAGDVPKAEVDHMLDLAERASGPGLQIEPGGQVVSAAEFQPPGGAELVGLLAAILILLITFGSVL